MSDSLDLQQQQALALAQARRKRAEAEASAKKNSTEGETPDTSSGRTILEQSLQGLPLVGTFTDELTSALGGLGASAYLNYRNAAPEILGGYSPSEKIEEFSTEQLMKDAEKLGNERIRAQQEENPWLSIGSQLGSGLLTGGALLKSAGATPTLFKGSKDVADAASKVANWANSGNALKRATKIAATGVPAAALYGLGEDVGEGRIANAEDAAMFGLIPSAFPIVGATYRVGKGALGKGAEVASKGFDLAFPAAPEISAPQKILQRLADDNMTLEGLEARLARAPKGSAIIDVGRGNVERLAEASANIPGKGANNAVRFVSKRMSEEPKKLKSAVDQYIGSGDFSETVDRIMKEADEKVKPLYAEAYSANPVVESDEIDRILQTPAGRAALKKSAELMQNDRKLLGYTDPELLEQAKLAGQDYPEGGIAKGLKFQTLDYVKRALDDMWRQNRGTNEGRILNNLRKDMVDALDKADATGKYKEARAIWSGALGGEEALENGRNFMRMDTAELKKMFGNLGESEKELFKLGAAQNVKDIINKSPDRTNMARKIFGRQDYRDNLQTILGRSEFNKLRAELIRQEKQHLMSGRLLGNSRTALRQSEIQDLTNMDPESAAALLTGNPASFMLRSLKNQLGARLQGINRDVAGNITNMLLETDPVRQQQIIQKLKLAKESKPVSPLAALKPTKITIRPSDKK